jgi:hypothetical protein
MAPPPLRANATHHHATPTHSLCAGRLTGTLLARCELPQGVRVDPGLTSGSGVPVVAHSRPWSLPAGASPAAKASTGSFAGGSTNTSGGAYHDAVSPDDSDGGASAEMDDWGEPALPGLSTPMPSAWAGAGPAGVTVKVVTVPQQLPAPLADSGCRGGGSVPTATHGTTAGGSPATSRQPCVQVGPGSPCDVDSADDGEDGDGAALDAASGDEDLESMLAVFEARKAMAPRLVGPPKVAADSVSSGSPEGVRHSVDPIPCPPFASRGADEAWVGCSVRTESSASQGDSQGPRVAPTVAIPIPFAPPAPPVAPPGPPTQTPVRRPVLDLGLGAGAVPYTGGSMFLPHDVVPLGPARTLAASASASESPVLGTTVQGRPQDYELALEEDPDSEPGEALPDGGEESKEGSDPGAPMLRARLAEAISNVEHLTENEVDAFRRYSSISDEIAVVAGAVRAQASV